MYSTIYETTIPERSIEKLPYQLSLKVHTTQYGISGVKK